PEPLGPVLDNAAGAGRFEHQSGGRFLRLSLNQRARGLAADLFVASEQQRDRSLRRQPPRDDRPQRFDGDRDAGFHIEDSRTVSAAFGRDAKRQTFERADRPDGVQMANHQYSFFRSIVIEIESGAQVSSVTRLWDQFDPGADFAQLPGDEARDLVEPGLFARLGLAFNQLLN